MSNPYRAPDPLAEGRRPTAGVRQATGVRFIVLIWICVAAAIAYIQRNSIGVAEAQIRGDLGLSLDQMGWAMSSFFVAYAFFQIPGGWLGQKLGTRKVLPFYSAAWSLATALMAVPGGFLQFLSLRFLSGAAQAGLFPCTTQTTSRWFPSTERAMTSGFLASCMSVGGALGAGLTGYLLPHLSWRWIFFWYAMPGALWGIFFYYWFREQPEDHAAVNDNELTQIRDSGTEYVRSKASNVEPTPWRLILGSQTMWWINAQHFFRGAGYIFYATWFPTFLKETRHVSQAASGAMASVALLAVVVGSPLGGLLSDRIFRRTGNLALARQGVAIASCVSCALLIVVSYFIENDWLAVLVISGGSLCAALAGPCAYAITIDVGGKHVAPVFSLMNMCGNIGSLALPIVVPRLVSMTGSWHAVLFMFAAIYVAAGICWIKADPRVTICEPELK